MGRKPDPRGKDRPRTIVLCGSVAEIAQKLADSNALSSTLSELLRREYRLNGAIEEKRAALALMIEERKKMQAQEEAMAQELDELEVREAERKTTLIPALEERLNTLMERRARLEEEESKLFDPHSLRMKRNQIATVHDMITEVVAQLQELRHE